MEKIITLKEEAKDKLLSGIKKINDAVAATMGPFGRNILIEKEFDQIQSTKDGITVAKEFKLEDPIENMGANVIRNAASKTVDIVGDGTTTATVLAYNIASEGLQLTKNSNVNVSLLKRGIEDAVKEIIDEIAVMSKSITSDEQILQVAKLSSNGDEEIAQLVRTALEKVGREGLVSVEESKTGETSLEIVEGMQFDRGYKSPFFVTDNNSMQCVLNEPYVLILEKRINQVKDLLPILEYVSQQNKSLLLIAEDIDGEALATLIVNKMRGILKVCAVKAPEFGERRTLMMEDIAILTGGSLVSSDKGMRLDKFDSQWLGQARTVTVGKETTTIVDGGGDKDKIKERIENLKNQIDLSVSPYENEKLQERLAKLVGGVAIINVGGSNEIEIKEKKDRLDDALQATKAALEEGVVPGAGVALTNARRKIKFNRDNDDYNKGKKIVWKAVIQPLETIINNSGESKFSYLAALARTKNYNLVPKLGTGKLVDCFKAGILDPTKVVRVALQNASSAAVMIILTEGTISIKKEHKKSLPNLDENY